MVAKMLNTLKSQENLENGFKYTTDGIFKDIEGFRNWSIDICYPEEFKEVKKIESKIQDIKLSIDLLCDFVTRYYSQIGEYVSALVDFCCLYDKYKNDDDYDWWSNDYEAYEKILTEIKTNYTEEEIYKIRESLYFSSILLKVDFDETFKEIILCEVEAVLSDEWWYN